jgi:sterol desaturase/sphingolipid hydroxylase (fatty acid hydroxylase superfamily)
MNPLESLLAWLAHVSTAERATIIAGGFAALFALELSLGATSFARVRHARTNLALWATTLLVNAAFAGATLGASFAVGAAHFGLLHVIALPLWLEVALSIALMDLLVAYVHHRLVHGIPLLWRFHLVHHSDAHVDSTTALRHSPVEAVQRALMTLLGVVVLGVSPGVLVLYQTVALLSAQWIHADLHLPAWCDRLLSLVFVSPGMHRVHHHRSLPWTDANYSTIFSLWDRAFGTFASLATEQVQFGIDAIPDSGEREWRARRVLRLALFPTREGYRRPRSASAASPSETSAPVSGSGTTGPVGAMIPWNDTPVPWKSSHCE